MNIKEYSKNIYELSEDLIYEILDRLGSNQNIDKVLTYVFIKAFYMHSVRLYLSSRCRLDLFDEVYFEYKNDLSEYYKVNNNYVLSAK